MQAATNWISAMLLPIEELQQGHSSLKTVFVPMHVDNWALVLATGYLGGRLPVDDPAKDVQELYPRGIVAFAEEIPKWAIDWGDPEDMVVVKVRLPDVVRIGDYAVAGGLIPLSNVDQALFVSAVARGNFLATFGPFPDVPTDLIPSAVLKGLVADIPVPDKIQARVVSSGDNLAVIRERRDMFAGWAAHLLDLLERGDHDAFVASQFRSCASSKRPEIVDLALLALRSIDPNTSARDELIWTSVVVAVLEKRRERGFDRPALLDNIHNRLSKVDSNDPTITTWIRVARDVVVGRRDVPSLDDQGSIGQRAALALLFAYDVEAIEGLRAGQRVKSLLGPVAAAFGGFTRMAASKAKRSNELVAATLWLADVLASGRDAAFHVSERTMDRRLQTTDLVTIGGVQLMRRDFETPPYILMLRARAGEAGYVLSVDKKSGLLSVTLPREPGIKIFIEHETSGGAYGPVARCWSPLMPLKPRSPSKTDLHQLLATAWATGCALGSRQFHGTEHICAFASQPTDTLDRDEFIFHITRVASLVRQVLGRGQDDLFVGQPIRVDQQHH